MKNNHWFVAAVSEMVDDAKRDNLFNVLNGLRTALSVFCDESDLTEEEKKVVYALMQENTRKSSELNYQR
ncbi:hypothetical protein [Ruegeria arenilitoris]|uniref:hypothetical protein n=1 Tax=Ruegeria arenilitoris TaxID=1173585 RepID=UPI00147DC897|nr:hypothetical protein [Ruegeria arenilitoris]